MNESELITMLNDAVYLRSSSRNNLKKIAAQFPYFFLVRALLAKNKYSDKNVSRHLHLAALMASDRALLHRFIKEASKPNNGEDSESSTGAEGNYIQEDIENKELMNLANKSEERDHAFFWTGSEGKSGVMADADNIEKGKDLNEEKSPEGFDLSFRDAEFSMRNIFMEEHPDENEEVTSAEIASMNDLQAEIEERIAFVEQEEFFLSNEIGGGGAEFIPTDYLNSENENEEFVLEHDAEVQSIKEMEEELIIREQEAGGKEKKTEPESETEMLPLTEDANQKRIIREENFDFRINEHVASPGEFLPEKTHTYSQWLRFFKNNMEESSEHKAGIREKENKPQDQPELRSFGVTMQQELESIDRIVSAINASGIKQDHGISPEELARKSSELNEEVVSETLALIYEQQGKHDIAIRQYVKLSLKYPQKVSFFASRIKELKSKK
ncbi:MAG: hypothetical protein ABIQ74_08035 [Chitinophagales bacterium]